MGSIIAKTKINRARIISQITALIYLNLPFIRLHTICAPVFYCHSCPLSSMACPLGVLVNFSTLRIFPFITVGIIGLVGILGGKFVCGWLCPFGFLQDMLYKIRTRKFGILPGFRYVKYAVLAVLVLAIPLFLPGKPYTFCNFCPAGTLESTIPWAFMGVSSGFGFNFFMRISILAGVLVLMVLVSRGFCRSLCPLGAIFSLFNKFSLFRINMAFEKCSNCGICCKECPVDIDPARQLNNPECTRCLDCTTNGHLKAGIK